LNTPAPRTAHESQKAGGTQAPPGLRDAGWLLLELVIAITVLTVGVLGFLFSFQTNFRATQELGSHDQAQVAMETAVEALRASDFAGLYTKYQGYAFPVPGLAGPDGSPASVKVLFYANEAALPAEFGPLVDIDGDGKRTNTNASANYVLLPARLTLDYQMSYGNESKSQYVILGSHR
jgi:type II secretory pathway pseudopilin PulG